MTRQEVLQYFKVNENGVIISPGKFEGEMLYVPHFYEESLNGLVDEDEESGVLSLEVFEQEKEEFPELEDADEVRWIELDDGRVVEVG